MLTEFRTPGSRRNLLKPQDKLRYKVHYNTQNINLFPSTQGILPAANSNTLKKVFMKKKSVYVALSSMKALKEIAPMGVTLMPQSETTLA